MIQTERLQLEQIVVELGEIENPYDPGRALSDGAATFAGRMDIGQTLGEALGRRNNYLTFMLTGERRMGKTSALRQLSKQLGARIVTVVYDLQQAGVLATTSAFLSYIAREAIPALEKSGVRLTALDYGLLRELGSDGEVYELFSYWLRGVESRLEKEDLVLLLTFDEFEKLEENGQAGTLNLRLLLDWFRSSIQNYPRLAFLFSGVKTIAEMNETWTGYFVNVKILRVSYLRPEETRRLILEPTLDFPGQAVFGETLAAEISRVTGGHPFLIQAICAALIENLNYAKRESATAADLEQTIEQLFVGWENYFVDLWTRTSQPEQVCLKALYTARQATADQLSEAANLPLGVVKNTLKILLKRDLIRHEADFYCIAIPIFEEWVRRNLD